MKQSTKRRTKLPIVRPALAIGCRMLALDVSSRAAGMALIRVTATGPRVDALALSKPPGAWDEFRRVDRIVDAVTRFAVAHEPINLAVIEWIDGIPWRGRKYIKSASQHMDRCKSAQAHVRQALKSIVGHIETVTATEWSSRASKEDRAERIKRDVWRYAIFKGDKGLDVADAIGIGFWRVEVGREVETG